MCTQIYIHKCVCVRVLQRNRTIAHTYIYTYMFGGKGRVRERERNIYDEELANTVKKAEQSQDLQARDPGQLVAQFSHSPKASQPGSQWYNPSPRLEEEMR